VAKILIVDDEEPIVALMKFILEKVGHTVATAYNGQAALQALGVEPQDPAVALPDLVILDVMMPIMDGYTAAVAIRNHPRTADLHLLVITAKGDMRQLFEAIPTVVGFFEKPFDPKRLREIIAQVVPAQ
jgi:CheY-like chemotaxis protein